MHIHCKFDGGKHINRVQGGSWDGRCAGSGLRQNLGPEWGPLACKDVNTVFCENSQRSDQDEHCRKRKSTDKSKRCQIGL